MSNNSYFQTFLKVRQIKPLIHHITNYVTVNDCANITLCAGGSPVMTHAIEDIGEMIQYAGALVLNIGTLDFDQVESMLVAGKAAEERGIPIILDPVGAGATSYRTKIAEKLISELDITILKGNAGEIGTLAGCDARVRGVDSDGISGNPIDICRDFAGQSGMIIAMSGSSDIVSNGKETMIVENGDPMMGTISGTGCMAASVTAAFAAVSDDYLHSTSAGLAVFGLAGEKSAKLSNGPGSFRIGLFDSLSGLSIEDLTELRISRVY